MSNPLLQPPWELLQSEGWPEPYTSMTHYTKVQAKIKVGDDTVLVMWSRYRRVEEEGGGYTPWRYTHLSTGSQRANRLITIPDEPPFALPPNIWNENPKTWENAFCVEVFWLDYAKRTLCMFSWRGAPPKRGDLVRWEMTQGRFALFNVLNVDTPLDPGNQHFLTVGDAGYE